MFIISTIFIQKKFFLQSSFVPFQISLFNVLCFEHFVAPASSDLFRILTLTKRVVLSSSQICKIFTNLS
ncbi:unnamed protein product [Meloidogyne enterolobii]|uniref:Uncharacterized protein n=1 Tax=Meloidogyne enterolobii TaxID=390850 RepID=A0ACB0ZLQ3_MELEN